MTGVFLRLDRGDVRDQAIASSEWTGLRRKLLAEIHDAAVVIDRQARVLCWNPGAERLFALPFDQIIGRNLEEAYEIRWLDEQEEEAALESLVRDGAWRGVNTHVLRDGRERRIESSVSVLKDDRGAVIGLMVLMRDITERAQLEAALRESEERLQLAQRVAQIGWFDWDVQNDSSVSSPEAQALHGLEPGSFHGGYGAWKAFVHPDDLAEVEQGVSDSLAQGGEHSHTHRVIWPDRSVHWLRTRFRVFLDDEGRPKRMVGVMLDVTDLKEAEELARLKSHDLEGRVALRTAALRESVEQMEAFVYAVSHDFRAPLRALEGFAHGVLVDDGDRLSATSREGLARIQRAARRMDALTADLVDYTRLETATLAPEPVSLMAILDCLLRALEPTIATKQARVVVARPLPFVFGHEATIGVVMNHLLTNALKFTVEGSPPQIRIWTEDRGSFVRFCIQDNGIGIAPEYQERIFRVFERLHGQDEYSGTGIGLAVVRKAITRMRGQAGLESTLGQGSCFWFELPRPTS